MIRMCGKRHIVYLFLRYLSWDLAPFRIVPYSGKLVLSSGVLCL